MSEIHPHWHTDDDEQPVQVRSTSNPAKTTSRNAGRKTTPRKSQSFSRRPAAVSGILLALWAGFAIIRETGHLGAQIVPDHPVIIVDEISVTPAAVTVNPGQKIEWINNDTIPHIMTSDTLATTTSAMLETPTIFPGSSETVTISPNTTPGNYTYISRTKQTITGVIIVESKETPSPAENPPPSDTTAPPPPPAPATLTPVPTFTQPPESSPIQDSLTAPPSPGAQVANALPKNPYAMQQSTHTPQYVAATTPAMLQGYQPVSQPETGPALWLASAASLLLLLLITRRAFRKIS